MFLNTSLFLSLPLDLTNPSDTTHLPTSNELPTDSVLLSNQSHSLSNNTQHALSNSPTALLNSSFSTHGAIGNIFLFATTNSIPSTLTDQSPRLQGAANHLTAHSVAPQTSHLWKPFSSHNDDPKPSASLTETISLTGTPSTHRTTEHPQGTAEKARKQQTSLDTTSLQHDQTASPSISKLVFPHIAKQLNVSVERGQEVQLPCDINETSSIIAHNSFLPDDPATDNTALNDKGGTSEEQANEASKKQWKLFWVNATSVHATLNKLVLISTLQLLCRDLIMNNEFSFKI